MSELQLKQLFSDISVGLAAESDPRSYGKSWADYIFQPVTRLESGDWKEAMNGAYEIAVRSVFLLSIFYQQDKRDNLTMFDENLFSADNVKEWQRYFIVKVLSVPNISIQLKERIIGLVASIHANTMASGFHLFYMDDSTDQASAMESGERERDIFVANFWKGDRFATFDEWTQTVIDFERLEIPGIGHKRSIELRNAILSFE